MAAPKALIDTNVWLRYLLEDSPTQFAHCKKMFERIEDGRILPYISSIVFLELVFTLKTYYKLTQTEIKESLSGILKTRNLTIIERTDSKKALELYFRTGIKYSDCLIASQIKPGLTLVTYDRDFDKLLPKRTITPEEIIP